MMRINLFAQEGGAIFAISIKTGRNFKLKIPA